MTQRVKLPVFEAIKLTYRWTLTILRKHWIAALVYALAAMGFMAVKVIVTFMTVQGGGVPSAINIILSFGSILLFSFAFIYLALISHNETQRGEGDFNAETVGFGGVRAFGYMLDCFLMSLVTMIVLAVSGGIMISLLNRVFTGNLLVVLAALALLLSAWCIMARLLLRLPSRAIGEPMEWRDVWRLGRGNTLRILGGFLLIFFALMLAASVVVLPLQWFFMSDVPRQVISQTQSSMLGGIRLESQVTIGTAMRFIPTLVSLLVWGIGLVVETVAFAVYLSLAYVYLRQAQPQITERST